MQIFLETERLLLRQFTLDDIDNLLALDSDIEVRRYLDMPASPTRESIAAHTLPRFMAYYAQYAGYGRPQPHKQGHFLPGTHIPILHPEVITATKPDCLVILPWNIQEEVRQQMGHIREWGGQFVTLIPDVVVSV